MSNVITFRSPVVFSITRQGASSDGYLEAESLQAFYEFALEALGVQPIKVVGSEFAVVRFRSEDVIRNYQQCLCDGDSRPFHSAPSREAAKEGRQIPLMPCVRSLWLVQLYLQSR